MNRGDSFGVQAGAAMEPGLKKVKTFSDEKPHILGDAPAGMDKDHHAVLAKHGYMHTGKSTHDGTHFYQHKSDAGRTAQYNSNSKKTSVYHSAGRGATDMETIAGTDHKTLDQKLGYGHGVSHEVRRWQRG
jgi:hypothetical protein